MQKGIGEYQIKKAKASKKEILKVLQDGKWHRYNEIKKATGLSSATLSKHLEELTNGIVEKKLDLESKEYPYPVLYRLKPFVFEKAKPIEPLFTKDYKLIRYDLHMLHHLCGMITLDFLRTYLENPKKEREEIFNQAFENYVIERYRESVNMLKEELLKEMEKEEKEVRKLFEKDVVGLLEENLELYKKDYDLLLKEIAKRDRIKLRRGKP
jgi:DNA-binding HxlR family transcriptional regulator